MTANPRSLSDIDLSTAENGNVGQAPIMTRHGQFGTITIRDHYLSPTVGR